MKKSTRRSIASIVTASYFFATGAPTWAAEISVSPPHVAAAAAATTAPAGAIAAISAGLALPASLMFCTAYVQNRFHREMTPAEAARVVALPFSCLFW